MNEKLLTATMAVALAGAAAMASPPRAEGAMRHALIAFDGANLSVSVDQGVTGLGENDPTPMFRYDDDAPYTPGGALDGRYYSSQYGWLQDGFITLDAGASIWIEQTGATPGLDVYEGGMRPMRQNHTYAPIFGTQGSDAAWRWPVAMVHHWYAADALGAYEATYRVYIGDETTGAALPGFGEATVTFSFLAVPAPGAAAALGFGLLACARRRRA